MDIMKFLTDLEIFILCDHTFFLKVLCSRLEKNIYDIL